MDKEFRARDISSLLDLQDFLETEIKDAEPGAFYRSFVPLTHGLGLESPDRQVQKSPPPVATEMPTPTIKKEIALEQRVGIETLFDEPMQMMEPTLVPKVSDILKDTKQEIPELTPPTQEEEVLSVISESQRRPVLKKASVPPPLPTPTAGKRFLVTAIDQVFVLTIWVLALVITANIFSGFSSGFSTKIVKEFINPEFLRFAILEFTAIWLCYLTVCVGVLDMTFGMWVWGIRVSYGNKNDSNYWMRKMMRVVWSFIFCAPIVPTLLLSIQKRGRSLLDVLSGTNLYVTA